jgi:hypothetical protein
MNVLFHTDAEFEFNAAIDYYEAIEGEFRRALVDGFRMVFCMLKIKTMSMLLQLCTFIGIPSIGSIELRFMSFGG